MMLPNRGGSLRWASVKPVPNREGRAVRQRHQQRAEPAFVPPGARLMLDHLGLGVVESLDLEQRRRSARLVPRARLPQHQPFAAQGVDPVQFFPQVADTTATHLGQHSGIRQSGLRGYALGRRRQAAGTWMPKSPLSQAISYALANWRALCGYPEDGDLGINNNPSKRGMRAWASQERK